MTVPHPSRPVRLAAAAAIAGLALGGCSMFSPQTTTNVTYAPSDGVQGEVGPVAVRNLMVLTAEQGAEAELVGALFNSSQDDVSVVIDVESGAASQTIDLEPGESLSIGPEADEQVTIETLDVVPGRTVEVTMIGGESNLNLQAPVLDGSLPEYASLIGEDAPAG